MSIFKWCPVKSSKIVYIWGGCTELLAWERVEQYILVSILNSRDAPWVNRWDKSQCYPLCLLIDRDVRSCWWIILHSCTPGLQVHAEQFLVVNALRHKESKLEIIAVSSGPCGHCRQFLTELACSVSSLAFLQLIRSFAIFWWIESNDDTCIAQGHI